MALVQNWLLKFFATLKEILLVLGNCFVANCVKPSRIFVSRMLFWLRSVYKVALQEHRIPQWSEKVCNDGIRFYQFVIVFR